MSNQSKKEYLATVRERYKNCKTRKEKSVVISEVKTNLGIVRKSAIRLLRRKVFTRRITIKSRKEIYGFDLIKPLKLIWKVVGQPCSKRLKPQMKDTLKEKVRVDGKVRKVYEEAKTQYQRLIESDKISKEVKDKLMREYWWLNPAKLQRNLRKKLDKMKDYRLVTVFDLAMTRINNTVRSHI